MSALCDEYWLYLHVTESTAPFLVYFTTECGDHHITYHPADAVYKLPTEDPVFQKIGEIGDTQPQKIVVIFAELHVAEYFVRGLYILGFL